MANDRDFEQLRRELLADGDSSFRGADAVRALAGAEAREAVQVLAGQLTELAQSVTRPPAQTQGDSKSATSGNSGGTLSTFAGDIGKSSGNFLLKGLTLAPIISGLIGLFRRDNEADTPAPVRFSLPDPIRTEAGLAPDGQTVLIDRGAGGQIRQLRQAEVAFPQSGPTRTGTQSGSNAPQNITVQVNAMDSRSFMDHSEDIARAVRDAMLHSHSLNDVVNDL
jgi:hypothetical protein